MRRGRPRKFKQQHRNAPWRLYDPPWGICRWCNKEIRKPDGTPNLRRRWHEECLHDFYIISDHKYAKRATKQRDKGICAKCGKFCRYRHEWQLDHVKPLIEAKGDMSYWRLDNLQTLCNACHEAKTARENSDRAKRVYGVPGDDTDDPFA
jgi:hypothetical protein